MIVDITPAFRLMTTVVLFFKLVLAITCDASILRNDVTLLVPLDSQRFFTVNSNAFRV